MLIIGLMTQSNTDRAASIVFKFVSASGVPVTCLSDGGHESTCSRNGIGGANDIEARADVAFATMRLEFQCKQRSIRSSK